MNISKLTWPEAPCCSPDSGGCACGEQERPLRAWAYGNGPMPPMTLLHREYCLTEIAKVEGFSWKEHENDADADLARTTLNAWTDFCRDKGLLP